MCLFCSLSVRHTVYTNDWLISWKSMCVDSVILLWYFFHMYAQLLSRVQLFATPWTVTYQAPLSMGFSRYEYWNGLPFPSPGDLPNPWIESVSPSLQADALPSEPPGNEGSLRSSRCCQPPQWLLREWGNARGKVNKETRLAPDSAYERNEFSESRGLHLPYREC